MMFFANPSVKFNANEDRKHVIYNGQKISMSGLAQKLLNTKFPVQESMYFTYRGKSMAKMREEKETNGKLVLSRHGQIYTEDYYLCGSKHDT